jgi:hypothetical protein
MENVQFFSKSFLAKYVWKPEMGVPLRWAFGPTAKWQDTVWYCDDYYNGSTCKGYIVEYADIIMKYMGYHALSGTLTRSGGTFGKLLPNGSWDGDIREVS